jgi:hypothetical protein
LQSRYYLFSKGYKNGRRRKKRQRPKTDQKAAEVGSEGKTKIEKGKEE